MMHHLRYCLLRFDSIFSFQAFNAARAKVKRKFTEAGEDADEITSALPPYYRTKAKISKVRNEVLPPDPEYPEDISIEGPWTLTHNGDPFLLADDGRADKILIFGTPDNLGRMCKSKKIHGDGTFKSAPSMFAQVVELFFSVSIQFFHLHTGLYISLLRIRWRVHRDICALT